MFIQCLYDISEINKKICQFSINPTICKGIKTMTENQNLNKINRIRKVMAKKAKYTMPELDESELILDSEDMEYERDKTNCWLESFTGKNQYNITENLCVNWQHISEYFTPPLCLRVVLFIGGWGGCPYLYIKSGAFSVYTKAMVLLINPQFRKES